MKDEDELLAFADLAGYASVPFSLMVEPDLGGEHTSLAVAPSVHSSTWFSSLPLQGREVAVT